MKIKIMKDGPYIVSGNIPLYNKKYMAHGHHYVYADSKKINTDNEYRLCRCGKTKTPPFCDGSHIGCKFDGTEVADTTKYVERANYIKGKNLDLLDDGRCSFARFCHQEKGNAWELIMNGETKEEYEQALAATCDCPSGRLTAVTKEKDTIEDEYDSEIIIAEDVERDCSAGIFVRNYIPIEGSNGITYEVRNRVALCRCGKSKNKPFCDATHVSIKFKA